MIDIIVTDDHKMFTEALEGFFTPETGIRLIGSAASGEELMEKLKIAKPHVVLLDINMPGMNGITATSQIRKTYPDIKILIVTMYRTREFIFNLYKLGVDGYLLKNTGKEELIKAVQTVFSGGSYFSADVNNTIMNENTYERAEHFAELNPSFSKRETEIVSLLADGLSTQDVADKLFLSYYTVETHRKNLLNKLNLRNTAELIKYAAQLGMFD